MSTLFFRLKQFLPALQLSVRFYFLQNIIRRSWLLPAAGVALMVVSSVLISGVYPGAIQQFQVKPSESSKEAPYIQKNIDATRAAYGLSDVKVTDYQATISTSAGTVVERLSDDFKYSFDGSQCSFSDIPSATTDQAVLHISRGHSM